VPHALPGADRMCIYVCVLFSGSHQAHAQCLVVPSAGRSSGVGVSASCVFCALVAATPTCIAPIVWAKPLGVPLWSVGHPTVKNSRRPRRCHPHSPRAPAMGNPCAPNGKKYGFPPPEARAGEGCSPHPNRTPAAKRAPQSSGPSPVPHALLHGSKASSKGSRRFSQAAALPALTHNVGACSAPGRTRKEVAMPSLQTV